MKTSIFLLFVLSTIFAGSASAQDQKFADLGDFNLENGQTLRHLKIGYRTFGTMNANKSNIVVYLMWAGGRTEQLGLRPADSGKMIDTNKYFVIAIDPLSNGVSSSPSNSKTQPRMKFPQYTIRDVVNSQYMFLTGTLKIQHVECVTGVSMGGMQTFQWMVSYPSFMNSAIPIVGSPQLAPYDVLHWQTQIDAIKNDHKWFHGNYKSNPARKFEYEIGAILLTTPDDFNSKMTRQQVFENIQKAGNETGGFDANNKIRQVQAMMSLDITAGFGGSWERAAKAIRARSLVIVATLDHVVTPRPALKLAKLLNAKTLILESECGHLAPGCESEKVNAAVANFLDNN